MPASFPNHPLSWTDAELAELAGTGLDNATKQIKAILEKIYEHLTEKLVKVINCIETFARIIILMYYTIAKPNLIPSMEFG